MISPRIMHFYNSFLLTNKFTIFDADTFLLLITLHVTMRKHHHHHQGVSLYTKVTKVY